MLASTRIRINTKIIKFALLPLCNGTTHAGPGVGFSLNSFRFPFTSVHPSARDATCLYGTADQHIDGSAWTVSRGQGEIKRNLDTNSSLIGRQNESMRRVSLRAVSTVIALNTDWTAGGSRSNDNLIYDAVTRAPEIAPDAANLNVDSTCVRSEDGLFRECSSV